MREETLTQVGRCHWGLGSAVALALLVGCGTADESEPGPDGGVGDGGAADASDETEIDAGPGTPVTGSWVNTRFSTQGKTPAPRDLSGFEIGVWTQGTSPRYVAGTGSLDGSFVVPNVPPGPFLLVAKADAGVPTCIGSDGSVRAFDLGYELFLESTPPAPDAAANSAIALTLANLAPWAVGDSIQLIHNLGRKHVYRGASLFPLGATMGALNLRYGEEPGLDGPGRGDEVIILQQGTTVMSSGLSVWTTRAATKTKALHTVDGQTVMASESLQPLPADGVVAFDLRRSQFVPLAPPGTAPSARIEVRRVPVGAGDLGAFTTSVIEAAPATTDLQIDARESNPFPATWTRHVDVAISFPVSTFLPGGMRPLLDAVRMHVVDRAEVLQAAPIVPRIGPPRAPLVAGRPADATQTGVGLTPTLSWTAPTLGQPTVYQLYLTRIDVGVDLTDATTQAWISTDQTSVRLPPGLLQRGQWYRFVLYAIAADGVRVESPARDALPWADASLISGRFTP